ncbi:MAG: hypothetical protein HQ591_02535 [candidate division Zixibacteria bacterium]|nr:hypothetical protein [Candidatus Tariuqbacter arcticus]
MAANDSIPSESIDILLSESKDFHEGVFANFRALDTKAAILLALFGLLLIPALNDIEWNLCPQTIFLICSTDSDIVGLIWVLLAIKLHGLSIPPDLSYLLELVEDGQEPDEIKVRLFVRFRDSSEKNRVLLDKKAQYLQKSFYAVYFSLAFYLISVVIGVYYVH